MKLYSRCIIAIDGHDGAGKTTLATNLAKHLNCKYVKPFNNSLGDMIAWLWQNEHFRVADEIARLAVRRILEEEAEESCLVFDRCWLTMFTVLPEEYFSNWHPLISTILCWTDVDTTLRRLDERGEDATNVLIHEHYCKLYKSLATRFDVPILDTSRSTTDESLERLIEMPIINEMITRHQ